MKKKLVLGMVALSLASGFLVFGKPTQIRSSEDLVKACAPGCCENGEEDPEPTCCRDTEMCCE